MINVYMLHHYIIFNSFDHHQIEVDLVARGDASSCVELLAAKIRWSRLCFIFVNEITNNHALCQIPLRLSRLDMDRIIITASRTLSVIIFPYTYMYVRVTMV